ncbi:MAG: DUF4783 domain-containing protein [Ginsengibacter sp.]
MKKCLLFIPALFLFASFIPGIVPDIIKSLKSGNAHETASFFDNNVEITVPGQSTSANKQQAEVILQNFFRDNPVKDFKVIHQSKNETSEYCIGTLITANGNFRTTIYTKQKNGQDLIQELRFEK